MEDRSLYYGRLLYNMEVPCFYELVNRGVYYTLYNQFLNQIIERFFRKNLL